MPILGEILAKPIIPKPVVFDTIGYQCFAEEVKAFHDSDAFVRIVEAPARTSKSYSAAPEFVFRALPHKPLLGSLQWIVGTDYETNKEWQYVWKYLVEEQDRWTMGGQKMNIEKAHNNPGNGDMLIVIDWGRGPHGRAKAIIQGKSSNNEKALQGEHITQIGLSEAADHDRRIWEKYLRTRYTWAIFPTTPKQDGLWLKEMIDQGKADPSLSTETFHFPPKANPYYDFEKFKREEKKAASTWETGRAEDDPYFAEQFLGRWTMYTGRVLPMYDRNLVTFDPTWLEVSKVFVSVDYGYEDACVALFWAVLPSGALLIFDEIYERHLTSQEFVEKIGEKLVGIEHRVAYVCGDPKQPQVARYMADYGLSVIDINKRAQVDRAVGHRRLVDLLSVDPDRGHPMLYLAEDRCPKTIAEWNRLRYREGFSNEYGATALKGPDHAFDAARYGVMTLPEPDEVKTDDPDAWVRDIERKRRAEPWSDRWARTSKSPFSHMGMRH
jgi:hypothetical protein